MGNDSPGFRSMVSILRQRPLSHRSLERLQERFGMVLAVSGVVWPNSRPCRCFSQRCQPVSELCQSRMTGPRT